MNNMGINWWARLPPEIQDARSQKTVAWYLARTFRDEWAAKRALLQWGREIGRRITEDTVRSMMSTIRKLRERGIPPLGWPP